MKPTGFLVMGVSGSGKTTLGKALALELQWDFFDADDFHPAENVAKMANGIPLDDLDRIPWLASLHAQLLSTLKTERHPVLACSALKKTYRAQLLEDTGDIVVIHLYGNYDLIWSRISSRVGHFMKPDMLKSQFDILEEPQDAFIIDVSLPLEQMLDSVLRTYFPNLVQT
jgi:gluconokinase